MALSVRNSLFGSRSCSDRHLFVCILSESGFTRFFDSQDYCFTSRPHHPANPINLDSVYPTNPAEPHHPVNPLIPLILIQTSTSV